MKTLDPKKELNLPHLAVEIAREMERLLQPSVRAGRRTRFVDPPPRNLIDSPLHEEEWLHLEWEPTEFWEATYVTPVAAVLASKIASAGWQAILHPADGARGPDKVSRVSSRIAGIGLTIVRRGDTSRLSFGIAGVP